MRILLTGASGLVGSVFARTAGAAGHEVIGFVGRWTGAVPGASRVFAGDAGSADEAVRWVEETAPDLVVHAAAVAEPAACLQDPERAQRINVDFPAALAVATARARIRLLHLSTEQVFDGMDAPYAAPDRPNPLHLYGRQKLDSEHRVLAADPGAAVVRLPLLFGNSLTGRRSVHEKLFEQWAAGRVAGLFVDEWRQVCTAESVAAMLLALAPRGDLRGVFHWAGAERVSRFELGRAICAHFGVDEKWIRAQQRAGLPEAAAARPRDLAMTAEPLDRELGLRPEMLTEAVHGLVRPAWAEGVAP